MKSQQELYIEAIFPACVEMFLAGALELAAWSKFGFEYAKYGTGAQYYSIEQRALDIAGLNRRKIDFPIWNLETQAEALRAAKYCRSIPLLKALE